MAEIVRILVVEDDESQLELYQEAAEELCDDVTTIEIIARRSADAAKEELLAGDFDGAVVDLNLSTGNPTEASGNDVLAEITAQHRFPVAVVSGNLENLDPHAPRSGFFKAFGRDTPNSEVFDYLLRIYRTGITRILGGRGLLEQHIGEIFWKHLACEFETWDAGGRDSERTLLRYTVTHLSEYLDTPGGGANGFYHEAEFYITPPIREHIATGDIVSVGDTRFIVLSPACDVAVRGVSDEGPFINARSIVLAPVFNIDRESFVKNGVIKEADGSGASKKQLEQIIKGQNPKYVLLPAYRKIDAGVVDLQNLVSWPLDEFLAAKRLATVAAGFIKDVQSRFAAYYGRQGQPDLDKKDLLAKYGAKLGGT